ncbi:hypothetical protein CAEBREN_13614 [Caenorhabditis brenneri]|uniref:Uncharacterized protein n=1 Tax=Caenorhabditis brenneri TaxID=135651 RepID=G0ND21_CAEBE|nr:hypothetical protein CAEBREN_13614 [Caenorhabditis brenneri]
MFQTVQLFYYVRQGKQDQMQEDLSRKWKDCRVPEDWSKSQLFERAAAMEKEIKEIVAMRRAALEEEGNAES